MAQPSVPAAPEPAPGVAPQEEAMDVDRPSIPPPPSSQSHKMQVDSPETLTRELEASLHPPVPETQAAHAADIREPRAKNGAAQDVRDTKHEDKPPGALTSPGTQPESTAAAPDNVIVIDDSDESPGTSSSSLDPLTPVPGLSLVAVGRRVSEPYELWFEVDEARAVAAQRWGNRERKFEYVLAVL